MPKLSYTHDLRGKARAVNSATEPKKNLQDFEGLAAALDWENITPFSLESDHIYDPGGGAPTPLKIGKMIYSAAPGNWAGPGFATVPGFSASFTVEAGAGIFVVAGCDCVAQAAGTTNSLRIVRGEGGGPLAQVGQAFDIGEVPVEWTAGSVVAAYLATAAAQLVELQFQSTAAPGFALSRAQMLIFVVNR